MSDFIKCRSDGTHFYPCKFMYHHMQYGQQKGIILIKLTDIKTHKPTRTFVVYKNYSGAKATQYIMNFCPFCGARIHVDDEVKDEDCF